MIQFHSRNESKVQRLPIYILFPHIDNLPTYVFPPDDTFVALMNLHRHEIKFLVSPSVSLLGMYTDILECEVKWALGSITTNKASGGDGIQGELFQILKDNAVKVLHSICQQIWKTQQWPQDWKRSVFIPIPKRVNAKACSNYHTIELISQASKVMLKILQARIQQYVNCELPDVHAGFRKGRGTRDQIANICWIIKKAREFLKNIYFCFIDYAKAFDCVDYKRVENSSRDGNTRLP